MTAERARLQGLLRVALLLQAIGLLGIIALTFPDWLDAQLHPFTPCGLCLDFRGLAFGVTATFLGPVIVLLLTLCWRWRGPRLLPLALVALIDVAAICLTVIATVDFFPHRTESIPPFWSGPSLMLLPALATLVLGVNLLRPVWLRPILAASTSGCFLLAACLWYFAVPPVHQGIPGEVSLPFSRTAVYEDRDLGCQDSLQGWINEHKCTRAALLVYRGSGDWSIDRATIDRILAAQLHSVPVDQFVKSPPADFGISRTDKPEVDPSNAGLCLIVTDRVTPPPPSIYKLGRCAMATDYADVRSHWPADDAYAIGIIYYWNRRDYVNDHSVTFLNVPVSAQRGHPATVQVRASGNSRCSVVVVDPSGQATVQGLGPKTSDAAGKVEWTWMVDASTPPGQWPITVTCGASSGLGSWFVYGPSS